MVNAVTPAIPTSQNSQNSPPRAPMTPSSAEIAALALSLAHLGGGPQAVTARRALRRLLDAELGLRPDDPVAEGDVIVDTLTTLTTPLSATTASRARILAAGISERMTVRLHYRDAAGSLSVRDVEPVTCLVHRDHWYLVAWCRLRRGVRAFRFDRLLAVEPTGTPARAHRAERFLPFQRRAA